MLDIKFIRENKDLVAMAAKKKLIKFDVDELIKADDKRREKLAAVEAKRAEQNAASEKIAKVETPQERLYMIEQMKAVKESLQKEEEELKEIMKEWQGLMVQVPNIPDVSVPEGEDDGANQEIRVWGEIPKFKFQPKSHTELMTALDMADFSRGTKVAGFRGYFLKNDGARLAFALWQYVLDMYVEKGFTPMVVPSLVRREPFMGTGYLPQSEEDLYKTQDNDYLSGTGEVATMGYFMDETLEKAQLPMKFISFSPCFRREAGSHGKDTQGLMRVHEFFKLEQVVLCEADHATSVVFHEELTQNAEQMLQNLGLPYHVVVNCGGDLGLGQVKKYDIETWVPSENKYRETHSSSYFHDFQTRRLNIRYRDADGKLKFAHSLNNTALASPRILIPLIENNQNEDGSIRIPEPLQRYMGGRETIFR
ncbi:MAG TPA: serine--tRNA ligase [Candidatus Paceibacterota bacterium]|nr:serine--tRNA ligase [Candidatus Paceibacterota bacterium]